MSCQVGVGRDHTLYALEPGYVRYYKQPRKVLEGHNAIPNYEHRNLHKVRKCIGVVLNPNENLPRNVEEMGTSRRFNKVDVSVNV